MGSGLGLPVVWAHGPRFGVAGGADTHTCGSGEKSGGSGEVELNLVCQQVTGVGWIGR